MNTRKQNSSEQSNTAQYVEVAGQVIEYSDVTINNKVQIRSQNTEGHCRVPLIARSWDLGSEEVETQGGNGRKWESKRGKERKVLLLFAK